MTRSRSPKKTKPVNAWVVLNQRGGINVHTAARTRAMARTLSNRSGHIAPLPVIPVLITPAPAPKRRKK